MSEEGVVEIEGRGDIRTEVDPCVAPAIGTIATGGEEIGILLHTNQGRGQGLDRYHPLRLLTMRLVISTHKLVTF